MPSNPQLASTHPPCAPLSATLSEAHSTPRAASSLEKRDFVAVGAASQRRYKRKIKGENPKPDRAGGEPRPLLRQMRPVRLRRLLHESENAQMNIVHDGIRPKPPISRGPHSIFVARIAGKQCAAVRQGSQREFGVM